MKTSLQVPEHLIFDPTTEWLPSQSPNGRFAVTPDELWLQLTEGEHNPEYNHVADPPEAIVYLTAWRHRVLMSEGIRAEGSLEYVGFHLTNSLAKVALHPLRHEHFSLKEVFRAEERRFLSQGDGRDPEQLSVLYNSLRLLIATRDAPSAC